MEQEVGRKKREKPKLQRERQFNLRLSETELSTLRLRAEEADIPMEAYARCMIFDYSFESAGGKPIKRKTRNAVLKPKTRKVKTEKEGLGSPTVPTLPTP